MPTLRQDAVVHHLGLTYKLNIVQHFHVKPVSALRASYNTSNTSATRPAPAGNECASHAPVLPACNMQSRMLQNVPKYKATSVVKAAG